MRLSDERRAWMEQAITRGDDASKPRDALALALMLRELLTYYDALERAHSRLLRMLVEQGVERPEDTTT